MSRPEFVWVFDPNRRVYEPAPPGRLWSDKGPIWREHWRKLRIVDENSRSYLDEYGGKHPKKLPEDSLYTFDWQDVLNREYVVAHRHKICDKIGCIRNHELLRKVADLIGYTTEPE